MGFSENLRQYRIARGITQTELARRLNFGRSTIAMYEAGEREPNFETLTKISMILDVSPSDLLGKKEESSPAMTEDEYDQELREVLEEMKNRPDMRMLFKLAKNAKAEDVRAAVKIIEALRNQDS